MAIVSTNVVVPTMERTSTPVEASSSEMCFSSSADSKGSFSIEVPSTNSSRTEFSSPPEGTPGFKLFAPVAVRAEVTFRFEAFSPTARFSSAAEGLPADDRSSEISFPDDSSFFREPSPELPSPTKAKSDGFGTSPEHAAIMAALNARTIPQPGPYAPYRPVRDRLFFGNEVYLEPEGITNNMIDMVINEVGTVYYFPVHADLVRFYSPTIASVLSNGAVLTKATIRSKMVRREWRWEDSADVETMATDIDGTTEVDVRIKLPGEQIRRVYLNNEFFGGPSPPTRVFAAFVDWLYKGYCGFTLDGGLYWDHHPLFKYDSDTLIQLWVFAGKIGVSPCQNHVIEALEAMRRTTNSINTSMLGWVLENTVDYAASRGECMLKRLLIDHCAWTMNTDWVLSGGMAADARFPPEVAEVVLERVLDLQRAFVSMSQEPPFSRLEWRQGLYWVPF